MILLSVSHKNTTIIMYERMSEFASGWRLPMVLFFCYQLVPDDTVHKGTMAMTVKNQTVAQ